MEINLIFLITQVYICYMTISLVKKAKMTNSDKKSIKTIAICSIIFIVIFMLIGNKIYIFWIWCK